MIDTTTIAKLSEDELIELEELLTAEYYDQCREDFWKFCNYWDGEFMSVRPFVKDIANGMQRIADGEIRRLGISMPPRAGKSYLATLFSAWSLGRNPSGSVMRNSCTSTLYDKFSYDVRGIVKDERFKKIFPDAKLSEDKKSVKGWNLRDSKQVGYFGGGVGTTILGFGADTLAILDDPIKDVEEALSEHQLEKKWDWYTGVHRSRLEKQCPEIHIATRWSRRDIIGRLEAIGELDETITVPALDKNDESFCEEVQTTKDYHRTREITAPFIWSAEYMQSPVEVKGLLYNRDELKTFDIDGFKPTENTVAVVDVADTGSDYLACVIANLVDDQAYIVDVVFTQEPIEVTEMAVVNALIKNKVTLCRVESNAGGRSFARNIERILRSQNATSTIEQRATTQNKGTRMTLRAGQVKEFIWFRDDDKMEQDYKLYMQQLCSTFKDVAKNKHDDAADATTMLTELMEEKTYNNWIVSI